MSNLVLVLLLVFLMYSISMGCAIAVLLPITLGVLDVLKIKANVNQ
ncbi:hypothetical protein [Photobacterium phosphoreum]|nr:hypothetical protein [Photobacterium phosphoreum]MCD9481572.1 hypothetical protein [Photobacterium phosphoreum]